MSVAGQQIQHWAPLLLGTVGTVNPPVYLHSYVKSLSGYSDSLRKSNSTSHCLDGQSFESKGGS